MATYGPDETLTYHLQAVTEAVYNTYFTDIFTTRATVDPDGRVDCSDSPHQHLIATLNADGSADLTGLPPGCEVLTGHETGFYRGPHGVMGMWQQLTPEMISDAISLGWQDAARTVRLTCYHVEPDPYTYQVEGGYTEDQLLRYDMGSWAPEPLGWALVYDSFPFQQDYEPPCVV